jgi:hypothetical protein
VRCRGRNRAGARPLSAGRVVGCAGPAGQDQRSRQPLRPLNIPRGRSCGNGRHALDKPGRLLQGVQVSPFPRNSVRPIMKMIPRPPAYGDIHRTSVGRITMHSVIMEQDGPRFRELRLVSRCHFNPLVRAHSLMRTPSAAQPCGCGLRECPVEQLFNAAELVVSVASIDVSGTFPDGPVRSARF